MSSNDAFLALTREIGKHTSTPARPWLHAVKSTPCTDRQRDDEPWTLGSTVDDERVDAALDQSLALARYGELDSLAWIDALPVPRERPPTHPGEHASTWRLLLHAWRLWRWQLRERSSARKSTRMDVLADRIYAQIKAEVQRSNAGRNSLAKRTPPQGTRGVPPKPSYSARRNPLV